MRIFTISAANYLSKAEMLARSVRERARGVGVTLVLVERTQPQGYDEVLGMFDEVILAETLLGSEWPSIMFKYDLLEGSTAIKPVAFHHLMRSYPEEQTFVYLDPDMVVYAPLSEVECELETASILVTPHHLDDETTSQATTDNVYRTLCCGVMNLGFLALSRTEASHRFLDWWWMRCRDYCFVDFTRGLFVDQKWVDLALGLFPIRVFSHRGYNVANWNISQRPLSERDGKIFAGPDPLVIFHFSGLDKGKDKRLFNRYDITGLALHLRGEYRRALAHSAAAPLCFERWSYGRFRSGEPIAAETRLACARNPNLLIPGVNPYELSNEHFLEIGY